MTTLPRGVTMVLNAARPPWTSRVTTVDAYPVDLSALSEEEDGDGKRHREQRTELVDSIGVRLDHPDGRAAIALWWRREGQDAYAFVGAQRGRHADENVPVTLNSTELRKYLKEEL
jgi:hypothetical protein